MRNTTNMRKGFTMIELIFVIVIIGILAAVAIPKLAATRDDAAVAARATQTKTAISEIGATAVALNALPATLEGMSNALSGMINNTPPQAAEAAGVATVYDITNDSATGCVTISEGTKAWTGVAATDAAATVTDGAWTQAQWDNLSLTKVVTVAHITNTAGGCPTIQAKIPAGVTAVKGRSAQF